MRATNKLILGTVQFGLMYGINNTSGKPSQDQVNEILLTAFENGIEILDTADAYGDAHQIIGNFHQQYPDHIFKVITKLPHQIEEDIDSKIEKYLEEMNVPKLNGLLFHSYNSYQANQVAISTINKYKESGLVEYFGVSIYTNEEMTEVIEDPNIDIIQLPFNLFDNLSLRQPIIERAREKGKIIHTRSAFLQGLFFSSLQTNHKIVKKLNPELLYLNQLAKRFDVPMQKMALNYCLQQSIIDNVLIGVDHVGQLKQNIDIARMDIPIELMNQISKIEIKDIDLLNPSLWNQ